MSSRAVALEAWLVRHVATEGNRAGTLQGWSDTAISPEGAEQLDALARFFGETELPHFDRIVTSDLRRTMETARAIGRGLDLTPSPDDRLREANYGSLEGLPAAAAWDMQKTHQGDPFDIVMPDGESLHQMAARVWACVDEAVRDPALERVLFVTHGGPISSLLARALGVPYSPEVTRRIRRDNAALTILRYEDRPPLRTRVVTVNATQHLW